MPCSPLLYLFHNHTARPCRYLRHTLVSLGLALARPPRPLALARRSIAAEVVQVGERCATARTVHPVHVPPTYSGALHLCRERLECAVHRGDKNRVCTGLIPLIQRQCVFRSKPLHAYASDTRGLPPPPTPRLRARGIVCNQCGRADNTLPIGGRPALGAQSIPSRARSPIVARRSSEDGGGIRQANHPPNRRMIIPAKQSNFRALGDRVGGRIFDFGDSLYLSSMRAVRRQLRLGFAEFYRQGPSGGYHLLLG
jgi:hypothetical protein